MWVRLLSISILLICLMLLVCTTHSSSPGPESAFVTLEFKSSSGKITQNTLTDTIGKQVTICLIHNLTQFIDASQLKIVIRPDSSITHSVKSFKGLVDTTYYPMVFSVPGNYTVSYTGYIDGQPTKLNGIITIVDLPQKPVLDTVPPLIAFISPSKDTVIGTNSISIKARCKDQSRIRSLIGTCNNVAFEMNKTSVDSIWSGEIKGLLSGTIAVVKLVATDSSSLSNKDSVSVKIKYDGDTSRPVLARVNPAVENASTNSSSYTITVTCNDSSGVLSVNATLGLQSFAGTRGTGNNWTIPVAGLVSGAANAVVVTAFDSSVRANTSTLNYAITFDPTMLDTIGPTITPVSGPASGTTVTASIVDFVVSVSDPNEVDSVYWTKNNGIKKMMTTVTGKAGQYSLNETLTEGKIDTLTLVAVDKATKRNQTKLTITLKYSEPKYTVAYNGNTNTSGTAPGDPGAYVQGATVTVATVGALVKDGYTFTGWNTAANGSGTAYAENAKFQIGSANVTLYAMWTLIPTYTVIYNANTVSVAGSVPVDETAYTEGAQVVVKDAVSLTKTGFEFTGWNTLANGNGTLYTSGAIFKIGTANVTLYAKWTIKKCQVTFNAHGGTVPESQTVDYGNLVTAPTSTLFGLTLVGWYSEPEFTNKWNFLTQTVSNSVTLHAKWAVMDIDGNVYDTVRIGSQTWMVQNLRTTKYNDGTPITKVDDQTEWSNRTSEAYCWVNGYAPLTSKYGLLYNHYAAGSDKIAPIGWHVPTLNEFDTFSVYLGANGYDIKSIVSKDGWVASEEIGAPGNDPSTNNKTNFSAYPSGWRNEYGEFSFYGEICIWWTTTPLGIGWYFSPQLQSTYIHTTFYSADRRGINIRCIKDSN